MSAITRDDVAHLARLARIAMTDAELDRMSGELNVILGAGARVQEGAAAHTPPTSHPLPLANVLGADEPVPSLGAEAALAAAPEAEDGRFRVPQILGDAERPSPRCRARDSAPRRRPPDVRRGRRRPDRLPRAVRRRGRTGSSGSH